MPIFNPASSATPTAHATTHESGGSDLLTLPEMLRVQAVNKQVDVNYSAIVVGPYTINSGKTLTIKSGGRFKVESGNVGTGSNTSNFISILTGSTVSGVASGQAMLGYGKGVLSAPSIITPQRSGIVYVCASGASDINGNAATTLIRLYISAVANQTAPSNGDSAVGNVLGVTRFTNNVASEQFPFSLIGIQQFLSVGARYWIDLSLAGSGIGIPRVLNVNICAFEL